MIRGFIVYAGLGIYGEMIIFLLSEGRRGVRIPCCSAVERSRTISSLSEGRRGRSGRGLDSCLLLVHSGNPATRLKFGWIWGWAVVRFEEWDGVSRRYGRKFERGKGD